jgi:hypothetical protein
MRPDPPKDQEDQEKQEQKQKREPIDEQLVEPRRPASEIQKDSREE